MIDEGRGLEKNSIKFTLVCGNESSVINIRQTSKNMFVRFRFKNYIDTGLQELIIYVNTPRYPQQIVFGSKKGHLYSFEATTALV